MAEHYVRMDLNALLAGVQDRLQPPSKAKANPWAEGWNDALYAVMDMLEGNEPIRRLNDGTDDG